jgi:hypothetical protein
LDAELRACRLDDLVLPDVALRREDVLAIRLFLSIKMIYSTENVPEQNWFRDVKGAWQNSSYGVECRMGNSNKVVAGRQDHLGSAIIFQSASAS